MDAIDRLGRAGGEKGNRTLAIIFADQGRKVDRALELAQGELEVRGDIYTYDALAWALYKNKKVPEAEKASDEALKFKTAEPSFYYHAACIAAAAGKNDRARAVSEPRAGTEPGRSISDMPRKLASCWRS